MKIFLRTGGHPEWKVFSVSSLCTWGKISYHLLCLYLLISFLSISSNLLSVFPHVFFLQVLKSFSLGSPHLPHLCQWETKVWRWHHDIDDNDDEDDDYNGEGDYGYNYSDDDNGGDNCVLEFLPSRLQSCGAHDHFDDKTLTCVRSQLIFLFQKYLKELFQFVFRNMYTNFANW